MYSIMPSATKKSCIPPFIVPHRYCIFYKLKAKYTPSPLPPPAKRLQLALLRYSFYCRGLEPVTMLHITSSSHIHFISGNLYLLTPLTDIVHSPSSCFRQPPIVSMSIYLWAWILFVVFCLLFYWFSFRFQILVRSCEIFFFSVWLFSLSTVPSSWTHVVPNNQISTLWLRTVPL